MTQNLDYSDATGAKLRGALALPEKSSGPAPGILVVHEAFGLGAHTIERAERLASLGYVALAVDMFGDRRTADDLPGAMGLMGEVASDHSVLIGRIGAALTALKARPEVDASRTGAIGFCFGGSTVLELARSGADVKGVVSFHGTLNTQAPAAGPIQASILVCHGDADPFVPPEQVAEFCQEMRDAGADWQLDIYGGALHGFTNPEASSRGIPALGYDAKADHRSWGTMACFFKGLFD